MAKRKKRPSPNVYYGTEAEEYKNSRWMQRNQQKTTEYALQLLYSPYFIGEYSLSPENSLVIDLGCGSGYSTEIIQNQGFHVVGLDISRDMLKTEENIHDDLIQADIRYLPFRASTFNLIISISAFNFVTERKNPISKSSINSNLIGLACQEVSRILKEQGRCIIEFYPLPEEEPFFLTEFKRQKLNGGLVINDSHSKKEQKFLLLQK